jgi:hypothetical protein
MNKFHLVDTPERSAGAGAANNAAFSNRKMSVQETAAYLGISKSFLNKRRLDGTGPIYLKIGRRVLGSRSRLLVIRRRLQSATIRLA